jgi:hypothetical protein
VGAEGHMPGQYSPQRSLLSDRYSGFHPQGRSLPSRLCQHGGWRLLRSGAEKGMGQGAHELSGRISNESRRRILRRELRHGRFTG